MEKKINLTVDKSENELRVDIFIKKREDIISRTRIKNLILDNKLKINNNLITDPSKKIYFNDEIELVIPCLLYTSPSQRDRQKSRMPSSA